MMTDLLSNNFDNFYVFRSEIHHMLKRNDLLAAKYFLDQNYVQIFFEKQEYLKSLYILSCIDTLCKKYNFPLNYEYDIYRTKKISPAFYIERIPTGKSYLEEFVKHGIYEVDMYECF